MDSGYLYAIEKRVNWLQWAEDEGELGGKRIWEGISQSIAESGTQQQADMAMFGHRLNYGDIFPSYLETLKKGDTFYMSRKFCDLVHHARETVPDDLAFEPSWMQAKDGWLWIDQPFLVPQGLMPDPDDPNKVVSTTEGHEVRVSAVGWRSVPAGLKTKHGAITQDGAVQFLLFQDFSRYGTRKTGILNGFGCWSYFMLQPGEKVIDRIRSFEVQAEKEGGAYHQDRTTDMMHEIRWIYAAMYLMSQRLATSYDERANRATRRAYPELGQPRHIPDFVRVVTLRRLKEETERAQAAGVEIDWQWQWEVRGHWRNQYFPSTGEHKPVFIEAYIKGPDDKPLKPPGHKLFLATR